MAGVGDVHTKTIDMPKGKRDALRETVVLLGVDQAHTLTVEDGHNPMQSGRLWSSQLTVATLGRFPLKSRTNVTKWSLAKVGFRRKRNRNQSMASSTAVNQCPSLYLLSLLIAASCVFCASRVRFLDAALCFDPAAAAMRTARGW